MAKGQMRSNREKKKPKADKNKKKDVAAAASFMTAMSTRFPGQKGAGGKKFS